MRVTNDWLHSFFFAATPFVSLALVRHRKREQRIGPSPANNYTEGYGPSRKKFNWFGLGRKHDAAADQGGDTLPQHAAPVDMRNSYATEHTRVGSSAGYGGLGQGSKYETPQVQPAGGEVPPMGNYPTPSRGYQYDRNDGVYR